MRRSAPQLVRGRLVCIVVELILVAWFARKSLESYLCSLYAHVPLGMEYGSGRVLGDYWSSVSPFAICMLVSMNHEVMARSVYSCFRPCKAYVSFSMVTIFDLASRSDLCREVELSCTRVVLSGVDSCRRAASRLRVVLVSRACHSTRHEYTTTTIVVTYTSTKYKPYIVSHCF